MIYKRNRIPRPNQNHRVLTAKKQHIKDIISNSDPYNDIQSVNTIAFNPTSQNSPREKERRRGLEHSSSATRISSLFRPQGNDLLKEEEKLIIEQ